MKRCRGPLLLAALLLLAGAVVNVAVAWGIAAWNRQWEWPPYMNQEMSQPPPWARGVLRAHPEPASEFHQPYCEVWVTRGPLWRRAAGRDLWPVVFAARPWVCRTQVGWPFPSLQSEVEAMAGKRRIGDIKPQLDLARATRVVGVRAPEGLGGRYGFYISDGVIPILPVLPGFLLNTLFYAVLVWAILALPLTLVPLRRRLRARRGRCTKCNYDLAGLAGPCPECGYARA